MATFSLEDLKDVVAKKYAPTVVKNGADTFTLPNVMSLPQKTYEKAMKLIDALTEDGLSMHGQVAVIGEIISLIEANGRGKELIELLGDTPAMLVELGSAWVEGTQLGEVGASTD